ncbi:MAG: ParB/RepB/Spo0J family partition protein [Planctomycetaceae bacterium]|nr:ParB/RepB/Spo0J family partition protein [Planctomycetaceae bacterium]
MEEQHTVTHGDGDTGTVRRRLGRGLNALLGDRDESQASAEPAVRLHSPEQDEISIELIERNPFQPRREFDQSAIDELAESLRKHGVLQPLLVRAVGDRYQLIAGERRWRAARQIGLDTIPCRVVEMEDRAVCEAAIEENLKRQDLNVIEKAQAFREYLEKFGGTIEDLSRQLSLNRSTVSNMLRLLELPEIVQEAVRQERISGGHARALLPLSADAQIELARQIEQKQLSVRKTEEAVRAILKSADGEAAGVAAATAQQTPPELTPHVLSLQDHLREQFAARIEIRLKKQDSGQIVFHFGSNDDFERIVGRLQRAA